MSGRRRETHDAALVEGAVEREREIGEAVPERRKVHHGRAAHVGGGEGNGARAEGTWPGRVVFISITIRVCIQFVFSYIDYNSRLYSVRLHRSPSPLLIRFASSL